ncbi:MAG TPA: transglycosylase SLT domain-containing protein [Clostridiales bacterium]|nr:transglycosylase SLT domain-containing protein [Clostridiales bacterium]
MPDKIIFAGKEVPLEKYDVRERLQKVFNVFTHDRRGFFQNLIDVQNGYLPQAKRVLSEFGVHPDLAYIIPAESEFNPRALSPAQASGLWQLMPATAKMYGLRVDSFIDERNHPERSARAAAEHLRMLSNLFPDDPFLVLAAYNNGDYNVRVTLENQKSGDFWSTRSNSETESYVEKIIIYKLLLSDPEAFGFSENESDENSSRETCTIVLGPQDLPFSKICELAGISYRELYKNNPHINFGSYKEDGCISKYTSAELILPEGRPDRLIDGLEENNYLAGSDAAAGTSQSGMRILEDIYEVKFNDNIESIAFRFRTDWRKIAEINDLKIITLSSGTETAEVTAGQKLRIIR